MFNDFKLKAYNSSKIIQSKKQKKTYRKFQNLDRDFLAKLFNEVNKNIF